MPASDQSPPNPLNTLDRPQDPEGQQNQPVGTISNRPHLPESDQPSNMMFSTRKSGLCESFKQFKQFQYDLHDDDDTEEVVFDVFDLQK